LGHSVRITATFVTVVLLAAASGVGAAGAAVDAKGSKIKLHQACGILSSRQVAKAFGGPAHPKEPVALSSGNDCNYPVGADPKQLPGGTLSTEQLFPNLFVAVSNAPGAVEDTHAIDTLSGDDLADVNHLGLEAYINYTKGVLLVAATKKFGFSLTWHPASVTHGTITHPEGRKLITLAQDVMKRVPR
jgi:hypothetical protein